MLRPTSVQKKHWIIYILPLILATVLYSIYVISTNFDEPENFSITFLIQSILFFYIYLFSISKADHYAKHKLPLKHNWSKQLTGLIIALIVSLVLTIMLYVMLKQFYISFLGQNDVINIYHITSQVLSTIVGFGLMYSIYITFTVYNQSLQKELKLEQARTVQAILKYEQLSSKLDPHFLFNNLNTLHTLLPKNIHLAENFIISLSKILRYSLQPKRDKPVSLFEELKIFREYTSIMKNRFNGCLDIKIDIKDQNIWQLYPMTLIHLLENAIKHNEISESRPLQISVTEHDDQIFFKNNLNPKIQTDSHGESLKTLNEIYRLKAGTKLNISESEQGFMVGIPLIREDD